MAIFRTAAIALLASSSAIFSHAFSPMSPSTKSATRTTSCSSLSMTTNNNNNRRDFLTQTLTTAIATAGLASIGPAPASARVFLDPAMYGDQELRVSAVDSLRESVRRALLQKPSLTPFFFELALLDGLSFNYETNEGGPDGSIIKAVLNSKDTDAHMKGLQECALILLESKKNLRKMSSITIADAVALAGAEAVNALGGPVLPTQLGRMDVKQEAPIPSSMPPLNLLTGEQPGELVLSTFRSCGLTEREMTALLGCLLSIDTLEKATPEGNWKSANKAKFRQRGKMGRMSEFKALSDEDIADELAKDGEDDEESYTIEGDDDWYIADTFGTQKDRFGKTITGGEQPNFSSTLKNLSKKEQSATQYAWIKGFLLNKELPTVQTWVTKYGSKPLVYEKDLKVAYSGITQLGAEYTGGKYESLLKNKKRKTLNDDDLDFLK